ncbi:MAG TPA: YihY family inner membrane protein [Stellaceae bacterium]|nr:YihY family inner membrane protein [Stellaceae bacterium]
MTSGETVQAGGIDEAVGPDEKGGLRRGVRQLAEFCRFVVVSFVRDGCFAAAGALSYTTLVSVVPLLAIALAILSAFPIFDSIRDQLMGALFRNFVPEIGDTAEWYIRYFAASAGKTTAVGLAVLGFTAIMLLATIEDRLDAIWRVSTPRPWFARVMIYWTVLTLGPILLAVGLSVSGSLDMMASRLGLRDTPVATAMSGWVAGFAWLVPVVLEAAGLTLIYCLLPHCTVRWRDAAIGAVVAALLFEMMKWLFTLYISHFASYQAVYGALAAIPIFLLWMYLSWGVVLFGAVIAAAVPRWRMEQEGTEGFRRVPDLALALALIELLAAAHRQGGAWRTPALSHELHAPPGVVTDYLTALARAGFVAETTGRAWILNRDLAAVTLGDLRGALEKAIGNQRRSRWADRLDPAIGALREVEAEVMALPIASVLDAGRYGKAEPATIRS